MTVTDDRALRGKIPRFPGSGLRLASGLVDTRGPGRVPGFKALDSWKSLALEEARNFCVWVMGCLGASWFSGSA